jgi:hypothetical protein
MKHIGLSFGGHPVFQSGNNFYEMMSQHRLKSRANERLAWSKKEGSDVKLIKYDDKWCVFMKMGIARTRMVKEAISRRNK